MVNPPPKKRPPPENKPSTLLSKEENDIVFSLLGKRCWTLASTVIQLYLTESPMHDRWVKKHCGVVCFVKNSVTRSFHICLYDVQSQSMLWEQELYTNFKYSTALPFLHTFEGHDCQVALNFANENEADGFRRQVETKIRQMSNREKREKQQMKGSNNNLPPTSSGIMTPAIKPVTSEKTKKKLKKKKKNNPRPKITKDIIGLPMEFKHVSHVGWDPDKGFDYNEDDVDEDLKSVLDEAGVSEKMLKDKDTRDFIYGFLDGYAGVDAVTHSMDSQPEPKEIDAGTSQLKRHAGMPPPVPARAPPTPTVTRSGIPPPLPTRAPAAPPPSRQTAHRQAPPGPASVMPPKRVHPPTPTMLPSRRQSPQASSSPSRPTCVGVPPPPPPPPPAMNNAPAPPPPPPPANGSSNLGSEPKLPPVAGDNRSALMDAIRKGKSLNSVANDEAKPADAPPNSRNELLNQIQKGIELKPVEGGAKNVPQLKQFDGLAGALAKALSERSRALRSSDESDSDDDDDDDEDDDEWD